MKEKRFEVVGIGNAIVDILANVEETFLDEHLLKKGSMQLVDQKVSTRICSCVQIVERNSGGSAANTIAGLAFLDNRVAFIGKVSDDDQGKAFEDSLKELGVHFDTKKSRHGDPTGHCVVLITPDAQRTMNTCLGVAGALRPEDIDEDILRETRMTFVEGYLWESPSARDAVYQALKKSRKYGAMCSLSLSDSYCVDRHREEFLDVVGNYIDILFANEEEIKALLKAPNLEKAIEMSKKLDTVCAVTRSSEGSVIIKGESVIHVGVHIPERLMDTTGAGDLYASGFIHAYLKGGDLKTCGMAGSIIASEAISHFGARPKVPLLDLLKQKGC